MQRRNFISAAASAGLGAATPPPAAKPWIFEIMYLRMRNGTQMQRANDFLAKHFLPAASKAGFGPMGFFNAVIGEQSPFVMALLSFPSMADFEAAGQRLAADKDFAKSQAEYNISGDLPYIRVENSLLRAFATMPQVEVPAPGKAPHIFELRTYESNNGAAAAKKVEMFNNGEIGIFRRLGMKPVFFGQTLVGRNLPNLTYMLAFDDLASREKIWRDFGADPEWQKLRAQPGYSDAEIVSNISNSILRPTAYSPIK